MQRVYLSFIKKHVARCPNILETKSKLCFLKNQKDGRKNLKNQVVRMQYSGYFYILRDIDHRSLKKFVFCVQYIWPKRTNFFFCSSLFIY